MGFERNVCFLCENSKEIQNKVKTINCFHQIFINIHIRILNLNTEFYFGILDWVRF